jgi:hypothetical protein
MLKHREILPEEGMKHFSNFPKWRKDYSLATKYMKTLDKPDTDAEESGHSAKLVEEGTSDKSGEDTRDEPEEGTNDEPEEGGGCESEESPKGKKRAKMNKKGGEESEKIEGEEESQGLNSSEVTYPC